MLGVVRRGDQLQNVIINLETGDVESETAIDGADGPLLDAWTR